MLNQAEQLASTGTRTDVNQTMESPANFATRLELAMEAGELGMWEWEIATNRMNYSERARAIYGFPPDIPLTYEMVRDATHPEDLPYTSAQAQLSIDPEIRERRPYEYRVIWPDGSIRWVLAFGQAIFEKEGGKLRATHYIGTIQDITARKEMELQIRASAEKLLLALAASDMAIWELDASGRIASSPELNRILGFPEHARPTLDEIHARYYPGELERVQEKARQAVARGERVFDLEFRYVLPDSSVRWLWVRAKTPEKSGEHQYTALGVIQDITEHKQREHHFEFMLRELSHRSKNLLAVIQAITHQTLRHARSPAEFETAVSGRLQALAAAHDLLLKEDWRGAEVSEIVKHQFRVLGGIDSERFSFAGPDVVLPTGPAQELSICIYELMTNALKYGALSNSSGRVSILWHVDSPDAGPRTLKFVWREIGGPPVAQPERGGFGINVLVRRSETKPNAPPALEFLTEGVRWSREWREPEFWLKQPS